MTFGRRSSPHRSASPLLQFLEPLGTQTSGSCRQCSIAPARFKSGRGCVLGARHFRTTRLWISLGEERRQAGPSQTRFQELHAGRWASSRGPTVPYGHPLKGAERAVSLRTPLPAALLSCRPSTVATGSQAMVERRPSLMRAQSCHGQSCSSRQPNPHELRTGHLLPSPRTRAASLRGAHRL